MLNSSPFGGEKAIAFEDPTLVQGKKGGGFVYLKRIKLS